MKNALGILGALIWGLLVFRTALGIHFPSKEITDRLQWEVQEKSGGNWLLKIEKLKPYGTLGFTIDEGLLFRF